MTDKDTTWKVSRGNYGDKDRPWAACKLIRAPTGVRYWRVVECFPTRRAAEAFVKRGGK